MTCLKPAPTRQYGVPVPDWNRALPDGEIASGTPIPAVVPMPTLPMAPIPYQDENLSGCGRQRLRAIDGDACPDRAGSQWVIAAWSARAT